MERYTEYHCGVAVIRNKDKLSEALKLLAAVEDAGLTLTELSELKKLYDFIKYPDRYKKIVKCRDCEHFKYIPYEDYECEVFVGRDDPEFFCACGKEKKA